VVLVVSVLLGTFLATSLLPAIAVGAVLLVALRAPVVRSHGTVRLRTDEGVDTVIEAFTGPTRPAAAWLQPTIERSPMLVSSFRPVSLHCSGSDADTPERRDSALQHRHHGTAGSS